MTREEADKQADKIFQDLLQKHYEIIDEAKKNGTWQKGLDSNNGLFRQVDDEAREKLRILASMIDE